MSAIQVLTALASKHGAEAGVPIQELGGPEPEGFDQGLCPVFGVVVPGSLTGIG